jgi:hypothetical protein
LALHSGVQDAGIFSTAARIFEAAGQPGKSQFYAQKASQINPTYSNFHMHH